MRNQNLEWQQFEAVDIRLGQIVEAVQFKEARRPAYQLRIDFGGEIGILRSSAQITELYTCEELINKRVAAVVNFPDKQIGPMMSQCLVLGAVDGSQVSLLEVHHELPLGSRVA